MIKERYSGDINHRDVDKHDSIAALRAQIAAQQGWAGHTQDKRLLGLAERAQHAAQEAGLHEVRPQTYRDGPAALGFACALAVLAGQTRKGAIIWIAQSISPHDFGLPYGPGLRDFGLDPRRIILVRTKDDAQALWAAEEGARAGVAALILQTAGPLGLVPARRLQLAAQARGSPLFCLRPVGGEGIGPALTRWRVASARAQSLPLTRWSIPAWHLALERQRRGPSIGAGLMEWNSDAHTLCLAAAMGDRDAPAQQTAPLRKWA